MQMDAIEAFADYVAGTNYENLPPEAVAATLTFIQDSFGVGIVGSAAPQVDEVRRAARLWGLGDDARVWVSGERLPAQATAFVNAFQTHNSEFDCIHEGAVVHCVTVVLAATTAIAERQQNVSGKDLMLAVALGVDVACVLGLAATSGLKFFRPATAGTFAATMGVGKLMGFNRERLIQACSIAYGQVGGTMQAHTEGSSLLAVQMGFAARNAIVACDLAAAGVDGPRQVIEGEFGYLNMMEAGHDLKDMTDNLGKVWRISEVAHKPFPSGRATHGIIDCCLSLRRDYVINTDDIKAVICSAPPLITQLVGRRPNVDMTPNYARLCGAYAAAIALTHGTVEVSHFNNKSLKNGAILNLAERITILVNDNSDPNALAPLTLSVELKDGSIFSTSQDIVLGNPLNPLSRDEHLAKFTRNCASARPVIPEAQIKALIKRSDNLENEEDISSIVDLMIA
jgi:aconitate decarboxylase